MGSGSLSQVTIARNPHTSMLSSGTRRPSSGWNRGWNWTRTMDSIEVNSERQSESYGTGEANVSLAGELTVPRPKPSEARAREVQVRDDWLYVELVDGRR